MDYVKELKEEKEKHSKLTEKEGQRHKAKLNEIWEESGVLEIKERRDNLSSTEMTEVNDYTDIVHKTLYAMTSRKRTSVTDTSHFSRITIRDNGVYRYRKTGKISLGKLVENKAEILKAYKDNKKKKLASEVVNKTREFIDKFKTGYTWNKVNRTSENVEVKYSDRSVSLKVEQRKIYFRKTREKELKLLLKHRGKILDIIDEVQKKVREQNGKMEEYIEHIRKIGAKYTVSSFL